CQHYDSTPHSF
nr:immunoglobulin light chain junction region [Macaca mulatta]